MTQTNIIFYNNVFTTEQGISLNTMQSTFSTEDVRREFENITSYVATSVTRVERVELPNDQSYFDSSNSDIQDLTNMFTVSSMIQNDTNSTSELVELVGMESYSSQNNYNTPLELFDAEDLDNLINHCQEISAIQDYSNLLLENSSTTITNTDVSSFSSTSQSTEYYSTVKEVQPYLVIPLDIDEK